MSGEQSLGGDCPGGNFVGGNYHRDRCLGGNYSGVIVQGAKDRGVIVLEGISWEQLSGGSCPMCECLDTPLEKVSTFFGSILMLLSSIV